MPACNLRFQQKLWNIVNCCKTGAVSWSKSGDSIIFKFSQFKREYLDRNINFCKSNKVASFVRQLNLYGFRKLVKTTTKKKLIDEHEFHNMYFQRGRKDLLEHVIRSPTTPMLLCKRTRRRSRKNRFPLKDNDDCHRNIKMLEANKENVFHSSKKCINSYVPNYQKNGCENNKNIISNYKKTNLVSMVNRRVFEDRENICNYSILKPFDYQIIKKQFSDEDITPKFANMEIETFESKPPETNFANIEDDFNLGSEETYEDEEYKNVEESREDYLNEPIVFNENALSQNALPNNSVKFNWRDDCEKSEELLALEDAYTRVNRHDVIYPCCVCNPNTPPSWVIQIK